MDLTGFKADVATEVTTKTAPRSIPATVVGGLLTDLADQTEAAVNANEANISTLQTKVARTDSLDIVYDNYLNPAAVMPSKYIDAAGVLQTAPNATYSVVKLLGLKSSQDYIFTGSMHAVNAGARWGFYKNDVLVAGSLHDAATEVPSGVLPWHLIAPAAAFDYALLSTSIGVTAEDYSNYMVADGAVALAFTPYGAKIGQDSVKLPDYYTKDQAGDIFVQANQLSPNLLKINLASPGTDDMLVVGAGIGAAPGYAIIVVGDPSYSYAKIPCDGYANFTFGGTLDGAAFARIRFEDANGNLIAGYDPSAHGVTAMPFSYPIPAGAKFALQTTRASSSVDYGTLRILDGLVDTGYTPYYKSIPSSVIPPEFLKAGDVNSPYFGKTILYVGDSQIAFNKWPPLMAAILGCTNLLNGVAGSCVTPGFGVVPAQSLCSATRLATIVALMATADITIFASGGNDSIQNIPVGTPTDAGSATATTFCSAVNYVLEYIQANATVKTKRFVWFGVLWTHGTFVDRTDQYNHTKLYDAANRECCERHGVPYLSTLDNSGLTRENEDVYTEDGTHLNDTGAPVYARMGGGFIVKY